MSTLNREGLIWTIVAGIAATATLVYSLERPERLSVVTVFQLAETVVTVDAALIAIFVNYAWRWPIFARWLVCVPALRKTWEGTVTPIHCDGISAAAEPISAALEIRQTLFHVACIMRTQETTSRSFAAAIFVDPESGERRLSYSYSADSNLRTREHNPRHDGTAVMTIGSGSSPTLQGSYWTDRLTRGELEFHSHARPSG